MTETYEIQKPIWQGELRKRCIGVADFRIKNADMMEVTIAYTRKDGTKAHPGKYRMATDKLKTYPTQVVGSGVRLYVAPLEDWEHVEVRDG